MEYTIKQDKALKYLDEAIEKIIEAKCNNTTTFLSKDDGELYLQRANDIIKEIMALKKGYKESRDEKDKADSKEVFDLDIGALVGGGDFTFRYGDYKITIDADDIRRLVQIKKDAEIKTFEELQREAELKDAMEMITKKYKDELQRKYGKREERSYKVEITDGDDFGGPGVEGPKGDVGEVIGKPIMVNNWYVNDKLKHEIRYAKHFGEDENGNAKLKIHFYDDTSVVVKIDEVNNKPTAPEGESVLSKEMDLEQRQYRLDRLTKQYGKGVK